MTDYNDGKWHGWNGGECPVHLRSIIDQVWHDEKNDSCGITRNRLAGTAAWKQTLKFRVVTPYVEPQTYTGKCWASQADIGSAAIFYKTNFSETAVFGTWTAEHVSGKLRRFSWEADE